MRGRNLFLGLFFILSGIAVVLNQLGIIIVGVSLVQLIATIFLTACILKGIRFMNFGEILIPVAILGILYSSELGIEVLTPWPILIVAFLMTIGLSIIFPNNFKKCIKKGIEEEMKNAKNMTEEEISTSEINILEKFAGTVKYINCEDLKKINMDISFSGVKIYLDNAKLEGNEASININTNFSGLEIYIPKNWKIENRISCVFGGVEEKGKQMQEKDKTLILNGKINFSGVTIIYI